LMTGETLAHFDWDFLKKWMPNQSTALSHRSATSRTEAFLIVRTADKRVLTSTTRSLNPNSRATALVSLFRESAGTTTISCALGSGSMAFWSKR
jgi:hypothetical protein